MERLPLETQTLYAELMDRLIAYEAERAIGHLPGGFVTKRLKGAEYLYYQYLDPGGVKRQVYVGRKSPELQAVVERSERTRAEIAEDETSLERLASLLRVGGMAVADAPSARVMQALVDAGAFRAGAVLVGTHAFAAVGNLLGVRWTGAGMRTQDIDIAAEPTLTIAAPPLEAPVPDVLESLEMGFLPVPPLNPIHSTTSFKVRGQGLRVDVLAPAHPRQTQPIAIPRLGTFAQPLKFLDYVIEDAVSAALIGSTAMLVRVPDPARFALHKLLVAAERSAAFEAKRRKDLAQASEVLAVLFEERPADVERAWKSLASRGVGWRKRALAQAKHLNSTVTAQIAEMAKR